MNKQETHIIYLDDFEADRLNKAWNRLHDLFTEESSYTVQPIDDLYKVTIKTFSPDFIGQQIFRLSQFISQLNK